MKRGAAGCALSAAVLLTLERRRGGGERRGLHPQPGVLCGLPGGPGRGDTVTMACLLEWGGALRAPWRPGEQGNQALMRGWDMPART